MYGRTFIPAPAAVLLLAFLLLLAPGCGPSEAPPLDAAAARTSLTTFLDAWKKGDRPDALKSQSDITVNVPEWSTGSKLVNYKLIEPFTDDGSNLHAKVEVELEDGAGQHTKKEVVYLVGTSPTVTIVPADAL